MPQPQVSIQDTLTQQHLGRLWFNRNQYTEIRYFGTYSAAATNEVFIDGITGNRLKIPDACGVHAQLSYVGYNTTGNIVSSGIIGTSIKNTGGTVALGGANVAVMAQTGDATPNFTVTMTADNTNDALVVNCVTSTTDVINWEATLRIVCATSPESNFGVITWLP